MTGKKQISFCLSEDQMDECEWLHKSYTTEAYDVGLNTVSTSSVNVSRHPHMLRCVTGQFISSF